MVALTEDVFSDAWTQSVVDGAGKEHEEHADNKEEYAKSHLPTFTDGWPHHPDG